MSFSRSALLIALTTASLSSTMFFSPTALAQEEGVGGGGVVPAGSPLREQTYETARGLGMSAGRASAIGTNAAAYNSANLGLEGIYHIESFFGYLPQLNSFAYGGSVADGTKSFAMGLSFYMYHGSETRDMTGYDFRGSVGMNITQRIGLGVSGRFLKLTSDRENANGEQVGPGIRAFSLDASVRLTIMEGLHIAALGNNLVRTHSPLAPLQFGGSVSYSYQQIFSVAVDTMVDLTSFDSATVLFGIGAEYVAGGSVPIRLGYRHDFGRNLNQLSAAVGYASGQFGLDLALRQDLNAVEGTRQSHLLLMVRYHVQ